MNSDGGLESACFTGQIPLRATFIGGNLDAANAFSLWGMRWAEHLGVHEDRGRLPAPRPVIELFVYCPEESVELAYAVAYLCECTWADYGFAGMAHVATDRIDALRDSQVIVDSAVPFQERLQSRGISFFFAYGCDYVCASGRSVFHR